MCPGFCYFTFIENNYPVGQTYICKPMADKNRGPVFNYLPEPAENIILRISIQGAGWFVEDEYRGIPEESSCQGNLLPLSPA
jgi:hypothetical protein